MQIKCGSRRIVFLFKKIVVKIPYLFNWVSFVSGIQENLYERYWYCPDSYFLYSDFLSRILWSDKLGLLIIMEKVDTELKPESYREDYKKLYDLTYGLLFRRDMREDQVGYNQQGKLVFCDYGFFGNSPDILPWDRGILNDD